MASSIAADPTPCFVHDLSYALGDLALDVEVSETEGLTRSPASRLRRAGFSRHYVASASTDSLELARRCIAPLREVLPGTSAIVYATCIPGNANATSPEAFAISRDVKDLMDFPASRLQAELGLCEAAVIGLNQQACTGMLGSLRLARALLAAEPEMDQILCLTADRFPDGALYEQSYNLISDGAAACLVSRKARGFRILACHQITNGALAQASDDESVGAFFNHAHRLVGELCQKAGTSVDKLDWIVPQNMNATAWLVLARLLGVAGERIYCAPLPEVGHVISADNVINLMRLDGEGRVARGARVLLVMAGFGMNWQGVLLEKI